MDIWLHFIFCRSHNPVDLRWISSDGMSNFAISKKMSPQGKAEKFRKSCRTKLQRSSDVDPKVDRATLGRKETPPLQPGLG